MSFLSFYFQKKTPQKLKGRCGVIFIKEDTFNRLVEQFGKDYKYILEAENFKNHWGYGYKYTIEDSHLILLNKFKDEIDNDDSLIYFDDDNSFIGIQEEFNINESDKQFIKLEEILL